MTSRNVVVASDRRLVFVQDDGTGEPRSVDIMPGDLEAILNDLPDIIITDRVPAAVAFMCGAAAERGANVAFVPSHDMSRKIFEENKRSFTLNGRINQSSPHAWG